MTVADTNWKGDAVLDNLSNAGNLELNVEKDTSWDGALNIAQGKATVSVKGAEWKQGVMMANSRFNSLTESGITSIGSGGNRAPIDTNVSAPLKAGDLTLYVGENTHWTGDVNITNGTAKIDTDHVRREGDVTLASDLFKVVNAEKVLDTVSLTTAASHGTGAEFSVYRPYRLEELAEKLPPILEKFAQDNEALQKISEDGKLALSLANTEWKGNLSVSRGTATVELKDSQWTGVTNIDEGSTLSLKDSAWTGKAESVGAVTLLDSEWHVTADSTLQSLKTEGDSAIFLEDGTRELKVKELAGEGTFVLDFKYKDDNVASYRSGTESDYLLVSDSASGSRRLVATPESDFTGLTAGHKLYFATTPADDTAFNITAGISKYVVQRNRLYNLLNTYKLDKELDKTGDFDGFNNWFLTLEESEKKPNENSHIPGASMGAALALWRDNDTLQKRLGEVRDEAAENGAWVRLTNRKIERTMKGRFTGVQLGYDRKIATAAQGDWVVGAGFAHASGKPEFDGGDGSGKLESNEVIAYATNLRENGHTIDIVGRVGRIDSKFTTVLGEKGEFENVAASLGLEYGKKTFLTERFALEPQAQLTYHYLWGDDYHTQSGIEAHQDNVDSLVGRLGLVGSYEWGNEAKTGRVYAKASVLHDFLGDMGSSLTQDITYRDSDDLGDTWYVVGLGTNVKLGKDWHIYVDSETSLNATVKTKYNLNAGVRFAF